MAILTSAILGTLVGGVTSILPGVIEIFNRRAELQYEIKMAEVRSNLAMAEAEHKIKVVQAYADAFEGKSLRDHDSSLDGKGWIGGLRASVRPVITYVFFLTFVAVKVFTIYVFIQAGGAGDWLGSALAWNELYPLIWDDSTEAMFGSVIGFWFGSRTIEKLKGAIR